MEFKSGNIDLKTVVEVDGKLWYLYSINFKSVDNTTYSTYLYAMDDYHAQLLVEDLKENGEIFGRVL